MSTKKNPDLIPITMPNQLQPAPEGWRWKALNQVARLESGHTPSRFRQDWWGGDISWLSLTEIRAFDGTWVYETRLKTNSDGIANSAARVLPIGTVCFSRTASVGFVAIMGNPMATSQDFANWVCGDDLDPEFLMYSLIHSRSSLRSLASGATHKTIYMPSLAAFQICFPDRPVQTKIASALRLTLAEAQRAREAADKQYEDVSRLADAIIVQSLTDGRTHSYHLGDVLAEVKQGIGKDWREYAVLGATRDGLAPAKEPPGKHAVKYKPVLAGTVFYNPMRIMIGSIAFVDEDDTPGITSPDYVVLRGREGLVDSRWFYYWLRSHLGVQCINSLARGAVRERMLFNRLAEGGIMLPDYPTQKRASAALKELNGMRIKLKQQLDEIALLPQKILSQAFEN
jgi:type I restriction enzyme S subunit